MKKIKFHFDPETLTYRKEEASKARQALRYVTTQILIAIITVPILFILTSAFVSTPKEYRLIRENEKLLSHYKNLTEKLDQIQQTLVDIQAQDDDLYRTIFNVDPIQKSIRQSGIGGTNPSVGLENYDNSDLMTSATQKINQLQAQMLVQQQSFDELLGLAHQRQNRVSCIPAIQPIPNNNLNHAPYGYGPRMDPVYHIPAFHYGMDFSAPTGTHVYATGNGKIIEANYNANGYGNIIRVDHGYGYITVYAHLSAFKAKVGDEVKRGQVIGLVGNTGKSVGPHLHYEVRVNGEAVNPINYYFNDLTPAQYTQMVAMSSASNTKMD